MKTYLLAIGVDKADQNYYQNQFSELQCCKNDVDAFVNYFESAFKLAEPPVKYKDASAKARNILGDLDYYSTVLEPGDILIMYYSGHGSQVEDISFDEDDGYDETLCVYDRMLIDDELFYEYSKFREGTRILFVSDSCHSGTVIRDINIVTEDDNPLIKKLDPVKAQDLYIENANKHKSLQRLPDIQPEDIKATIWLLSACQDEQYALAGDINSVFTGALLNVLTQSDKREKLTNIYTRVVQNTYEEAEKQDNPQLPNYVAYGKNHHLIAEMHLDELVSDKPKKRMTSYGWDNSLMIDLVSQGESQEKINIAKRAERIVEILKQRYRIQSWERIDDELQVEIEESFQSPWDAAYEVYYHLNAMDRNHFVYPNRINDIDHKLTTETKGRKLKKNEFLKNWPSPDEHEFDWHLKQTFSQLEDARKRVIDKVGKDHKKIRIAHIDTGYFPDHPSTPEFILSDLGKSFVKKEEDNKGLEIIDKKFLVEMDYHGMGTIALLAAPDLSDKEVSTYGNFSSVMGAIPFAEVLPIRIGDTVMLLGGQIKALKKAIDYAIKNNCDVITMSMAGAPSRLMAKAINKAYEAGVVIVSAASNNSNYAIDVVVPDSVLYPARYQRVIAATGAAYNKVPYDFIAQKKIKGAKLGEHMQGNWGPPSAMKTAIAAYTPNVPWAAVNKSGDTMEYYFQKNGGGTSAATPQVAAAAALWLLYNRDKLEEQNYKGWEIVEAVKYALFNSADESYEKSEKYYGNGMLKALDALDIFPPDKDDLKQAPPASESWFQLHRVLNAYNPLAKGSGADRPLLEDETLKQMFSLEIEELLMEEFSREDITELNDEMIDHLKSHPGCSEKLRNAL